MRRKMAIAGCLVAALMVLAPGASSVVGSRADGAPRGSAKEVTSGSQMGPLGCPPDREDLPNPLGAADHPTVLPPGRVPSKVIVCFYGLPGRPSPALSGAGDTEQRRLIVNLVGSLNRLPASPSGISRHCPKGDNRAEFVRLQYANGEVVRALAHPTGCRSIAGSWSRLRFTMTSGVLRQLERTTRSPKRASPF
jgi:hypothetical protein